MNFVVKIVFAVILISEALRSTVFAQAQTADPKACANGADMSAKGNLSDKLNRSSGVICPPDVDSGIKAPAPDSGKMPVIPPPGSPGGDQNIQPK